MENEVAFNIAVSRNFIPAPITSDQYVLGASKVRHEGLMKYGHGWGDYLPLGETQSRKIDAQSCPVGGWNNIIEAIGNFKFNKGLVGWKKFQDNLSERYAAIAMGMNGNGGNPHVAAEFIRYITGCLPEAFLPFNDSIDTLGKYFSPKPLPYSLFKYGYAWMQKYDFRHQWVITGQETLSEKQAIMKEWLQDGPIGVAGYAWSRHADGKYYNDGQPIHWFIVYDYVENSHWLAFDTYPDETGSYVKKLDWNYNFAYAKSGSLNLKAGGESVNLETPESAKLAYVNYLIRSFLKLS